MGCHTWFERPITKQELEWMREWALKDAEYFFADTDKNRENGTVDLNDLEAIKRSVKTGEACYYGMTWYEAGFGEGNPKFKEKFGRRPYISYVRNNDKRGEDALYFDVSFDYAYLDKFYNGMSSEEFWASDIVKQVDFPYFHDVFRVRNYPDKIIHNRRELRRFLRKKYFELSDYQLQRISMFFKMYPGGIIRFG